MSIAYITIFSAFSLCNEHLSAFLTFIYIHFIMEATKNLFPQHFKFIYRQCYFICTILIITDKWYLVQIYRIFLSFPIFNLWSIIFNQAIFNKCLVIFDSCTAFTSIIRENFFFFFLLFDHRYIFTSSFILVIIRFLPNQQHCNNLLQNFSRLSTKP